MAPRGGKKGAAAGEPAKEQPAVVGGLLMPLNALDGVHSLVLPAAAAPLAGGGSAEGVEALKSQLGGLTEVSSCSRFRRSLYAMQRRSV